MAKEKVTLTLDSDLLGELRQRVGARSLSATVDDALATRVAHLRHLAAVDDWLAEMEAEDGPISPDVQAWADTAIGDWFSPRPSTRDDARRAG